MTDAAADHSAFRAPPRRARRDRHVRGAGRPRRPRPLSGSRDRAQRLQGSERTAHQSVRPAARLDVEQLLEHPDRLPLLAGARQFALDRAVHRRADAHRFLDGRLHLRASALLRRQVPFELHPARTSVPGGDRDRAAVHQDPRSRPAQFLLGRHPAASRLLAGDGRAAASATRSSNCRANCSTPR